MMGRAVLVIALIASIPGPASLASARATNPVLPQGAELTDTELAQIEGSSTWISQVKQTCAAAMYWAAACGVGLGVITAVGYVLVDKTQQEIDREISPLWVRFITDPLINCGPWGWRCW
jgi:hypothetical protein